MNNRQIESIEIFAAAYSVKMAAHRAQEKNGVRLFIDQTRSGLEAVALRERAEIVAHASNCPQAMLNLWEDLIAAA